jgi:hypothetical protein
MRCTASKPNPSPATIDSTGKPGMGGVVGVDTPVTVNMLVEMLLVVV